MTAHKKDAYVWQLGRFDGDVEFWKQGVSESDRVDPVDNDECLRFYLNTGEDFQLFHDAATRNLEGNCLPLWVDQGDGGVVGSTKD